MNQVDLSVIIITKNEERDLPGCLDSVKEIASEIIVVDSGSSDRTLEVAGRYTSRIFHHEWKGYSAQKQFALDQAHGQWVLNLDADERLTPLLREEITKALRRPQNDIAGFEIPFQHFFMGRLLRFGSVKGETHVRLFLKARTRYGQETVHEGVHVDGKIALLRNPIEHQSYATFEEYWAKSNAYTSAIAKAKFDRGERFSIFHHLRLPYEFVVRYFMKLGFLDGQAGFIYAALSAYYVWMKYLKLRDYEGRETWK